MKPPSFIPLNASDTGGESATWSLKLPLGHVPSPRSRISMKPPSFIPLTIPHETNAFSLGSTREKTSQPNSKSLKQAVDNSKKKENRPPPHNVQRRLDTRPAKRSTSIKSKKPTIGTKAVISATEPVRTERRKSLAVRNAASTTRVMERGEILPRLGINRLPITSSALPQHINQSTGRPTAKKK